MGLAELVGLAGVPVIVALVQACKAWVKDERYWPLLAIALGVLLNVALAAILKSDYGVSVIVGVIAGLAAAGLYDVGKDVAKK